MENENQMSIEKKEFVSRCTELQSRLNDLTVNETSSHVWMNALVLSLLELCLQQRDPAEALCSVKNHLDRAMGIYNEESRKV